jgi:hypothetical protein
MDSFITYSFDTIKKIQLAELKTRDEIIKSFFRDNVALIKDLIVNERFNSNLSQLAKIFDFNNDGKYSFDDIEFLKTNINDLNVSLKLMKASFLLIDTFSQINEIKLNHDTVVEFARRFASIAIILPLTNNINELNSWLSIETNRETITLLIQNIYSIIASSDKMQSVAQETIGDIPCLAFLCNKNNKKVSFEDQYKLQLDSLKSDLNTKLSSVVEEKKEAFESKITEVKTAAESAVAIAESKVVEVQNAAESAVAIAESKVAEVQTAAESAVAIAESTITAEVINVVINDQVDFSDL